MKKRKFLSIVLCSVMTMLVPQSIFPVTSGATDMGLYVNVEDYGANGRDNLDDMDAIQNAINAVCDSTSPVYGRSVYLPGGTYIVHPSPEKRFVVYSNLHITGDRSAVIKVADNAGDYGHLFGQPTITGSQHEVECIENFSISNITIDQNGDAQTTSKVQYDILKDAQICIWLRNFKNVRIEDVQFNSYSGVNCIIFGEAGYDSYIQNCYFKFVRVKASDYDNSAIYNCGKRHIVTNNVFYAELDELARGAIETHQGVSVVSGNISDGFNTLCNIVCVSPGQVPWTVENDITVTNNTVNNANAGICFWSVTGQKLSNVTVANNTISLTQADHNHITNFGIGMSWNIDQRGSMDNINIVNNTIKFQKETAARAGLEEAYCYGIGILQCGDISNVNVTGNIITNAPFTGIKVGQDGDFTYKNVNIKNNMIINSGAYSFAKNPYFRCGIMLSGPLENVVVEENMIRDDNDIFGGFQSIQVVGQSFKSLRVTNNDISAKQGGYYYNVPASTPNLDVGQPFKIYYNDQFPIIKHMTLEVGDLIYNTGILTPGASYCGYRVTASGTTGTLNNVTATTIAGSSTVTVSDSSGISVGDYINIAGGGNMIKVMKIAGNELLTNRQITANLTNAAVSFHAPTYKGFGQLSRS